MQELQLFKAYKISIHLYCGSHVGSQKSAYQPIFPYNIIENCPTSLARNSVFVGPYKFKFVTETHCMHGVIGYTKIWSKLIIICKVMFLMTSYANHQYCYGAPNGSKIVFGKGDTSLEIELLLVDSKVLLWRSRRFY